MRLPSPRRRMIFASAMALAALALPVPVAAQMPVFDATNYSQNLLQAARALEQINHQVRSLQNQATMLENMATNLKRIDFPQLTAMTGALQKIDGLMDQARAISFKAGQTDAEFKAMFPGTAGNALGLDQRVTDAKARLQSAMDSFRRSMSVQSEVVSNITADSGLLKDLAGRSQDAVGALQAQQATNQLLALSAKQQLQLEDLLAAEFRSQSIERATKAEAEAEARAATTHFLGTGKAYSRTHE